MPKIKDQKRPAGAAKGFRFFKNEETGNSFKAKHETRINERGDPVLAVAIHPADAPDDAEPFWHTHTFTKEELIDPAFDPEARLASIIDTAVEQKETHTKNINKLKSMTEKWGA